MMEIVYEFVELESDESFRLLGTAFNANCTQNVLLFDNSHAEGAIIKLSPEEGLWIRKWKMTVLGKITLRRIIARDGQERRFSLIYFLNPPLFSLRSGSRKIKVGSRQSNMLVSNNLPMEFSVVPNEPFYVLDITFTDAWLLEQFSEEDKKSLAPFLKQHTQKASIRSGQGHDWRILHEIEQSMQPLSQDIVSIRPKIYALVVGFFSKILHPTTGRTKQISIHYNQIVEVESILSGQLQSRPKIDEVAKKVNMSVSTLLRQFKTMYGRSVYEYHVEKKMQLAKKMILEDKIAVKEVAKTLGYKQVSPFIELFAKHHGCTPGSIK